MIFEHCVRTCSKHGCSHDVWIMPPVQAVHAWPDNWQVSTPDFMTSWVNCHIQASASLGKPMVLEEVCLPALEPHRRGAALHARSLSTHQPTGSP